MKNIFKLFTFCFVALLSYSCANAQKCKFDYEKEDPFTSELTKGNTSAIYPASPMSNEYWYLGLNKTGDDFHIGLLIQLNGELNTYLNKGDSIMFKLSKGEVVICYANEQISPTSNAAIVGGQPVITSQYRANYTINADQLKLLEKDMVTFVRMNVGDKVYEREIKEKHAKKLMKNTTCILN